MKSPTSPQTGVFQSEAEAMKARRRQAVEKKFSKVKKSLNKEREHRLADLKVKNVCSCVFRNIFYVVGALLYRPYT